MPGASTDYDPQGNCIVFEEKNHKYYTRIPSLREDKAEVEVVYTSVTSLIKKYCPPFDPDGAIAARCAERDGKTVEEVRAAWKAKGEAACTVGTRVHEVCEDVLRNRAIRNRPRDEHERRLMQQAYEIATSVMEFARPIGIEKIVFDVDIAVAGTIDLLCQTPDGGFKIVDWKTNDKIERENPYNKFMTGPLAHLADNDFNHYAMQLSVYQVLLLRRGYVPANAQITRDIFHITDAGVEHLEIPFLGMEAYAVLLDHAVNEIKAPF